ncbi:aminotransferase class V-fold PLP-dependent enzyme [Aneurinibacillus aneurinilyticus]|uniref:Aminotransferase class V-fold PLP-dependent enzyme n=1 Tax=Aneurinibacillus aneurinilyticus TaxID=1391 RepID=A0A848CV02_ANEAE|nr:aminotransferase class V-fold PLP-dependent enzyme [Aneurinibacillus aneurinilyticus]NME97737.1 aminotransferase class V-fold PLP-dependent enzyme [Aneurinibacillus aneurinilyticus]
MRHPYDSYRSLFPILSTHVYLASCSQSALAQPVSYAIEEYHHHLLTMGNNWSLAMERMEATRRKFADIIGAEPDEVAVLPSASDAISSLAASFSYQQGKNKIVCTELDFPTVGHIWLAQRKFGANVSFIRSSNEMICAEQYEKEIAHDTLLTCVPHVCYYNGYKQDLREIADIVHSKSSLLFVDAYQSAGHIPIHVKEMDIDILVAGTRKYMLGIPGVAFLYIKKNLAERMEPRVTGWLGQKKTAMFDICKIAPEVGARRFETGTPSFISMYAAHAALELLHNVGVHNIYAYLQEVTRFALAYGREKGLCISGPQSAEYRSSLISFYVGNASEVEMRLKEKNIVVSARKDVIRIAPHFYNTKEEIKYAIDELIALINGR